MFGIFGTLIVVCSLLGIALDKIYLIGVPAVVLVAYWTVVDLKKVFWLLLFSVPLSVEIPISTSLATDLPTEPLMVLLMGVSFIWFLKNGLTLNTKFLKHPLSILVLLHIGWAMVCTIGSENFIVSLKWTLAKFWYIISFYFLVGLFVKEKKDFKYLVWIIALPLSFALIQFFIRFGMLGFAFDKVNKVTWPFFRNHVNYAAILAVFLPFVWFARFWYKKGSFNRRVLFSIALLMLLGVYLSYTRTAYGAVFIAMGTYFIVRWKLIRAALVITTIAVLFVMTHLYTNDTYLDYAPTFEKAITHTNFNNLLSATSKGEDISTMERVYRWVGGIFMFKENPVLGFGPGNFYNFYQEHALNAFKTYVSNNPDRSSIHCYFLLMLCEQGLFGLLFFLGLAIYSLILGERIYHRTSDPFYQHAAMAVVLSLVVINSFLLINDMMETDKVGSFFFIGLALLVRLDFLSRKAGAKIVSLNKEK